MVKLAVKDMKILKELDFQARQPISQIARKVGLSPEVTSYRIKQLENKGIIEGYYPIIDLSKLGYIYCRYIIELERTNSEIEKQFISFTKEHPGLGWFVQRGNMNISLSGYITSVEGVKHVLDDLNSRFYSVIKTKRPSIATKIYHFKRNYLYKTRDYDTLVWGENTPVTVDLTDKKILLLLTDDIRFSSTDIARNVKLSTRAVIDRIKRMEKERLILGYRAALNLQKLGYSHHKVELFIENLSQRRKEQLIEYMRVHPNIVYVTDVLDLVDLEFEAHLKSDSDLYHLMTAMRQEFPEIKRFNSTPFHKEIIFRYLPGEFF